MKQRSQAIAESLYNVSTALDDLREAVYDLNDCGASTTALASAVKIIEGWVDEMTGDHPQPSYPLGSRRLTAPVQPTR
jgi:vacuolar-type H+-ATPase catalytic subunit A/Vma1